MSPGVPWTHAGPRPREWYRKSEPDHPPGTELGTDQHGQDSKTSARRLWFSHEWWIGHHHTRAADGSWADWGNAGKAPRAKWGTTLTSKARQPTKAKARANNVAEYRNYLHTKEQAADAATNGYTTNAAGKAKGYDSGSFFHYNTSRRPGRRYMTDELRAFLSDGDTAAAKSDQGGPILTMAQWTKQTEPEALDTSAPWTHARRRTRT